MKTLKATTALPYALMLAGVIAGCATAQPPVELLTARQEVQSAIQDPGAAKAGALRLEAAQKSLGQAEMAYQKRESDDVIKGYAYGATRNAQIAREQAAEARGRATVAAGEAERNRVVLQARTEEADKATDAAATNARIAGQNARQANDAQDEAARLKDELAAMKALPTERGMVLTLGDVLFDTNKASLKPGAQVQLERVAGFMQSNPDFRVIIEGYTDSRGTEEYNEALSARRADAVRSALVHSGINADRVRAVGLGEKNPVATNADAAGQTQNRRVEVVFSDDSGAFASSAERGYL